MRLSNSVETPQRMSLRQILEKNKELRERKNQVISTKIQRQKQLEEHISSVDFEIKPKH